MRDSLCKERLGPEQNVRLAARDPHFGPAHAMSNGPECRVAAVTASGSSRSGRTGSRP
jgi:hypothetical protein